MKDQEELMKEDGKAIISNKNPMHTLYIWCLTRTEMLFLFFVYRMELLNPSDWVLLP